MQQVDQSSGPSVDIPTLNDPDSVTRAPRMSDEDYDSVRSTNHSEMQETAQNLLDYYGERLARLDELANNAPAPTKGIFFERFGPRTRYVGGEVAGRRLAKNKVLKEQAQERRALLLAIAQETKASKAPYKHEDALLSRALAVSEAHNVGARFSRTFDGIKESWGRHIDSGLIRAKTMLKAAGLGLGAGVAIEGGIVVVPAIIAGAIFVAELPITVGAALGVVGLWKLAKEGVKMGMRYKDYQNASGDEASLSGFFTTEVERARQGIANSRLNISRIASARAILNQ